MKVKSWIAVAAVGAVAAVSACSGGGGGGGGGGLSTAQFIDAPVKGLTYNTGSGASGVTGAEGKFSCQRGDVVSFSLKGLNLGQAACGEKIFVQDLFSYATNYSWNKAAAIIQTFSSNSGGVLDLTAANSSSLDLTGFNFGADGGTFETNLTSAHTSSGLSTTLTNLADALTHANASLTTNINLSESFENALDAAVGTPIYLKATRTSGDAENCWNFFAAKTSVTKSGGVFWFNVDDAAGYNDDQYVDTNGCTLVADEDDCEDVEADHLPKPKIISGTTMDLIFSNTISIDIDGSPASVQARNRFSLNATMAGSEIVLTGSFQNYLKVLTGAYQGQSVNCNYSVAVIE